MHLLLYNRFYHLGIPDLGIPPAEPLYLESMSIGGASGAMNVKQKYKNIQIYDIINSKVDDAM